MAYDGIIQDWVFIIIPLKLIIIGVFIWLMLRWKKRNFTTTPNIGYWIIGFFITFYQVYTVINSALIICCNNEQSLLWDRGSIGSLSVLLAIGFYFWLGLTRFRGRTRKEIEFKTQEVTTNQIREQTTIQNQNELKPVRRQVHAIIPKFKKISINKNWKNLGYVGLALLSLVFYVIVKDTQRDYGSRDSDSMNIENIGNEKKDELLRKVANEINKKMPMMVDAQTRLDNCVVLSDNTLQYNYTFVNNLREDFSMDLIENEFAPMLLNDVKTNPGLKPLRDLNVAFIYSYKDKEGVHVYRHKITSDMYND